MRLSLPNKKLPPALALLIAVVVLWVVYSLVMASIGLLFPLLLAAGTFALVRPELRALLGSKRDPRPWLVRLREHRWRPVGYGRWKMPRGGAYLLLVVLWWWVL